MLSKKVRLVIWMCEFLLILLIARNAWASEERNFALTTDITWASKYMISGYRVGGDHPVWQMAGKVDLSSSGFSVMYWTSLPIDRDKKKFDEHDFFILYAKDFFQDRRSALNIHGFYDYWIFPNEEPIRDGFGDAISNGRKHGNKFQLGVSLPRLFPLYDSFLVPSYNVNYIHYWAQDRSDQYQGGSHHELLLEYYHAMPIWIPGATYQYAGLTGSTNYHNGDFGVRSGLSHSTASLVGGIHALQSIFVLSLNQQWSYEETVNPNNESWTTLSFIKRF